MQLREIATLNGDSTPRSAAGAVIYGVFRDVAFEIGDTHEDSTPRAAKRPTLSRNRSLVRRFCRVLSVRWGGRSSVSRAARGFCPAGPQNHGTSESQVTQFACGTPVLAPRSVKTRHNGGPEAPGGGRQATGARIRKKHLRNRHLSLVLEVEIVAVAPPARGRRPAALRPTVEPAYRTQPGRSGFQICRVSAVRRQRIGVPHAIRATRIARTRERAGASNACSLHEASAIGEGSLIREPSCRDPSQGGSPTTAIFTANSVNN